MTFEVSIEVTECPANREEWKKDIKIHPQGLTEALMIHLEMICECDCELPKNEASPLFLCWLTYILWLIQKELIWERDQDRDQNGSLYFMLNRHTATYVGT